MKLPDLEIRDLLTLVALAEYGSLTLASAALGLSVSALSHRIRDLEQRLNMVVVIRGSKLSLTPEALRMIPLAYEALDKIRHIEHIAHLPHHEFSVGVSFILSQSLIGPLVPDTIREFPQIHWTIRTGNSQQVEDWIERGHVNAGIIRMEHSRPNLSYQIIGRDSLVAVTIPESVPAEPMGRREMTQLQWVTFSPHIGHGRTIVDHLEHAGLILPSAIEVDSLELGLHLVLSGVGPAVLPWSLVSAAVEDGTLSVLEIVDMVWPNRYIAIAHLAQTPLPAWVSDWPQRLRRRVARVNGEV